MNLTELKTYVDSAVSHAKECGESTDEIVVSIQIDLMSGKNSMCVDTDIEVHYDNNLDASGCVITAVVFDKQPCNTQLKLCGLKRGVCKVCGKTGSNYNCPGCSKEAPKT